MREIGTVTEVNGKTVTVRVDKKDECSKCGMCLFPKGASGVNFYANNTVGAKDGDLVEIELCGGNLIGAILAFLVPLILLGISAAVTYLFIKNELWLLILGVGSILIWYLILPFIDKKLSKTKKFTPKIIKLIKNNTINHTQGEN